MEGEKKTKGRQKIEIKKIENDSERQVTFSKRKSGVFKKASEMATLCSKEVGVVVFSESGKPFSYGNPSIESVAHRFIQQQQNQNQNQNDDAHFMTEAHHQPRVDGMIRMHNELESQLEVDRLRSKELQEREREKASEDQGGPGWWNQPIEELDLAGLKQIYASFERLHNDLYSYLSNTTSAGRSSSGGTAGIPSALPPGFGYGNGSNDGH